MGLFDGYVDPEQFNSGGGLLGRLLALQQFQGQYQPGADSSQVSSVPQVPSPASMLSPLLSYDGQPPAYWQPSMSNLNPQYAAPWPKPGDQKGAAAIVNPGITPTTQTPVNQQNFAVAGDGSGPAGLASSTTTAPTLLAQYVPTRPPVGIPLPPVFVPGTPENDAFVHSTITAGRTIGNAVGNILNSDNAQRPPAGSRPINETPWSGDHGVIKGAIDAGPTDDVRISPAGEVWHKGPDGSWTNHGPVDTFTGSGKPSGRRGKDRDQWR